MIISHVRPESWIDTEEQGVIQPSEVAELPHSVALEASDVELFRGLFVLPAGMVLFFATAAAPVGWLICNGATVSRADFPILYSAVGEMYGAGDGISTFKLPDLRGEFLRGADLGRGIDSGRALGSFQIGQNESHTHGMSADGGHVHSSEIFNSGGGSYPLKIGSTWPAGVAGTVSTSSAGVHAHSIGYQGGGESRPRNLALLPCISVGA